ncbi:MAG: protein-L-isoaspartate(D-aspartate) O-methyltransferase [Chloroflexi bacterium]|nr:protein-L-isoaspartate(D-aspartate) O-methyltransferase [Chloroflexota bacterium]
MAATGFGKQMLIEFLRRQGLDESVLTAFEKVPRERFVLPEHIYLAYEDIPLPIGEGQTISQPYIVALMTQELELGKEDRVLELGTGSGYHAAILAELAGHVVSVERLPSLAERAKKTLHSLGYTNVDVHPALPDALGWPPAAPYSAIVVSAAAPHIPRSLLVQLGEGGRMVIPVGTKSEQELLQVRKQGNQTIVRRCGGCRFVPLIGPNGWPEEAE